MKKVLTLFPYPNPNPNRTGSNPNPNRTSSNPNPKKGAGQGKAMAPTVWLGEE